MLVRRGTRKWLRPGDNIPASMIGGVCACGGVIWLGVLRCVCLSLRACVCVCVPCITRVAPIVLRRCR